ncbi:MAG: phosphatase PAP2 family protein [Clostridia bacterium]|nr:phosphatase PAP2 family protein [Clostridia bacterium]
MKKRLSLSALFLALFIALIAVVSTVDVAAIGPEGTKVGLSHLNQAVHEALGENMGFLYNFTKYLGYAAILLALGFAAYGAVQLIQRRSLKKVDKALWALAGLYAAVALLYVLFEKVIVNYRPMIMPGDTAPEASFPSTHTMLFFTILGSVAMVAGRYVKNQNLALLIRVACVVLIILGVAFRLGSGVHWLTDICGGILISSALLLAFSAVLDTCDNK